MHEFGQYQHATILPDRTGVVSRGGCIRFDDDGPKLHVNSGHNSVGIIPNSVWINESGDLEFTLDVSLPVIRTWVSDDETMVLRAIRGGLSGGVSVCVVKFRQEGMGIGGKLWLRNEAHYKLIAGSTSNVWVGVDSFYEKP